MGNIPMTKQNLKDLIRTAGGPINLLRAHKYDRAGLPREFNPALIIPQTPGGRDVRFLHLPANCDTMGLHYDTLWSGDRDAGVSAYTAYSANERTMLSLALVDQHVEIGDEVVIHWGEAGGGHGDYVTPATQPVEIRAIVSPAPYSRVVREQFKTAALA